MKETLLWENPPFYDESFGQQKPTLIHYPAAGNNNAAVIVCAGGAYIGRADYEGAPIAEWLQKSGVSAFVISYRVNPYLAPVPQLDLQRAIRYVRYNAKELNIDPDRIGALGFSAGGHLVSSCVVHFDDGLEAPSDDIDKVSCKLNAGILCYPVITMKEFGHEGSKIWLLGENPSEELVEYYSSETQVTPECPPCFIWHTYQDQCVPVRNSFEFADALQKAGVSCELHIYELGHHGLGMPDVNEFEAGSWPILCENWLKCHGFIIKK